MPSVVKNLTDTGAIKKARKAIHYDDVQFKALGHGFTWSDTLLAPWHAIEWCIFKVFKLVRPLVWKGRDQKDWNSAGMLTTYAQGAGVAGLATAYGMGWMGHEKGLLSGLKQAMWFVIGAPIRLVYWPVVKIMDRFKKDEDKAKEPLRLVMIDMTTGDTTEEGCVKYDKTKHDEHAIQ